MIYTKGLEGEIDIVSPGTVGGLASPAYKVAARLARAHARARAGALAWCT